MQSNTEGTPKAQQEQLTTLIRKNVVVLEKDFKKDKHHTDKIQSIISINDNEFLTSSIDNSLKVWDKFSQGSTYTYETHEALHAMAITGERSDMLIIGLGDGNLMVYGLHEKNQKHINEAAHNTPIIKIVSLSRLKDKYFATRCQEGNVVIWSATGHPDKLNTIEKFDSDAENSEQQECNPSARDSMIELRSQYIISQSTTILCCANFNDQQTIIANFDIKTRSRVINKRLANQHRPTYLYQYKSSPFLLVGTESGRIEHWNTDEETIRHVYDAHTSSKAGISSIIELKSPSPLITGEASVSDDQENQFKFVVTAAFDSPEFRIWKLANEGSIFKPHIKIDTSLSEGISNIIETSSTQLVCVDHYKSLKFYDFVDKADQEKEAAKKDKEAKLADIIDVLFKSYDENGSGYLEEDECQALFSDLMTQLGKELTQEQQTEIFEAIDSDKSGKIHFFELKAFIMREILKKNML